MRYLLLLLLTAPAFAGVKLVETPPAPPPPAKGAAVLIPAPNVLYTVYLTGAGTRAVLTPEQGGVCWNRYKMFEVNRYSEAMRGCWSQSNGIVHIELQDGDRRAIPAVQFIQTTPEALRF